MNEATRIPSQIELGASGEEFQNLHELVRKARANLKKDFDKKQKDLDEQQEEVKKAIEDLNKKRTLLPAETVRQKEAELQERLLRARAGVGGCGNEFAKRTFSLYRQLCAFDPRRGVSERGRKGPVRRL